MREQWQLLAARFDGMTPRERALVLFGGLAGIVLVFYVLVLEPLTLHKHRLSQQIVQAQQTLATMDSAIQIQQSAADPAAERRSYRNALRRQLAEMDEGMQDLSRGLVAPERMARLLEDMLAGERGPRLIALRTLPVRRFTEATATKDDRQAKPGTEPERAVYQHGYELVLEGSYAELHDYLARLESLPWRMFWGGIRVDASQHPRLRATLTVQTLSLSRAWLIV
jgi:MSHA biogenesis protein MshJ